MWKNACRPTVCPPLVGFAAAAASWAQILTRIGFSLTVPCSSGVFSATSTSPVHKCSKPHMSMVEWTSGANLSTNTHKLYDESAKSMQSRLCAFFLMVGDSML